MLESRGISLSRSLPLEYLYALWLIGGSKLILAVILRLVRAV